MRAQKEDGDGQIVAPGGLSSGKLRFLGLDLLPNNLTMVHNGPHPQCQNIAFSSGIKYVLG